MKITYSISVEDYVAIDRWFATHNPQQIRSRLFGKFFASTLILVMPCMLLVLNGKLSSSFSWGAAIFGGVIAFFVTFLAFVSYEWPQREKAIRAAYRGRRALSNFGQCQLELTEDSLIETNDVLQLSSKFLHIMEIKETPEYVIINLGSGSHLVAREKLITGNLEEFLKELRLRWNAALEKYTEPPENTFEKDQRRKVQPGMYFFIVSAILAIPSLIAFAIMNSAMPSEMENCLKILNTCTDCGRCKDFVQAEMFFNWCAPTALLFLLISFYMFYKNSKNTVLLSQN